MSRLCILLTLSALPLAAQSAEAPKVTLAKGDTVVFLGDSITEAGTGAKGYVTLIEQKLAKKLDLTVIGAGISGNKVPDLQARLQKHVLDKKPNVVVIYIGINDVWHGLNNPKGGTSPEKFEAGLRSIIGRIHKAGARVLLCTPSVIGEKTGGGNAADKKLDQYSAISRKVAKDLKVPVCDLRKAFLEYIEAHNKGNADKGILTGDTVHLNEAGNRLVAETIMKSLGR